MSKACVSLFFDYPDRVKILPPRGSKKYKIVSMVKTNNQLQYPSLRVVKSWVDWLEKTENKKGFLFTSKPLSLVCSCMTRTSLKKQNCRPVSHLIRPLLQLCCYQIEFLSCVTTFGSQSSIFPSGNPPQSQIFDNVYDKGIFLSLCEKL